LLAVAMAECLEGVRGGLPAPERIRCIVGSTADGSIEYVEATVLAGLQHIAREAAGSAPSAEALDEALELAMGRSLEGAAQLSPWPSYRAVVARMLGAGVKVLAVDAACASSLASVDIGLKALRSGECDAAIVGGAFAPGPSNGCLFAQFQGLS